MRGPGGEELFICSVPFVGEDLAGYPSIFADRAKLDGLSRFTSYCVFPRFFFVGPFVGFGLSEAT
jgi:hypothetical protein